MAADRGRVQATGVFAWLKANDHKVPKARLKELGTIALAEAWRQFAQGDGEGAVDGGLPGFFRETSFQRLGLRRRSDRYRARQRRIYGKELPLRSPKKGSGHLADLIRQPGVGFRSVAQSSQGTVFATLRMPGARVLNLFARGDMPAYKAEFFGQRVPPRVSLIAAKLFWQWLTEEVQETSSHG